MYILAPVFFFALMCMAAMDSMGLPNLWAAAIASCMMAQTAGMVMVRRAGLRAV